MRWDYNYEYRDKFDEGPHRDILIVPHATYVEKVPGSQPFVRSKVPVFQSGSEGQPIPDKYKDLEFVITNEDIVKEKFEISRSINSAESIAFGSCEAAMVKFTIRNKREWNEAKGIWEPEIPNLQKIEVLSDDGTVLVGEVQGAAIIEVYQYINGDSSTLMWLGMYQVEEDKVVNNGYEREITAYDFMLTFRDMDIYEWYKGLFKGVPVDSDDPSKGIHKQGKSEWTIGEALHDLFENLAYLSPSGPTITNPKDYLVDMDAKDYPGYGMPIIIDPDLEDPTVDELVIPTGTSDGAHERYGYMPILNLPFHEDENIIKKGSYSCGKFLEDIAMLAGRFGCIRRDIYEDGDYATYDPTSDYHYNHYEKCILTFRPIDKKDGDIVSENVLDNSDVQKGIQYDYYDHQEIKLLEIYNYDNKSLGVYCPSGLSEDEIKEYKQGKSIAPAYIISENTFTSYLKEDATGSISGATYTNKNIIDMLFSGMSGINDGKPFLDKAFKNMIYRPYRPYQLTSYGDLCREPGDRIKVSGVDKVTGEPYEFISYIFEVKTTGIQKMMDTYSAKGNLYTQAYSDYRSGDLASGFMPQSMGYGRYSSEGGSGGTNSDGTLEVVGMTVEDFVEYLRNIGFRLLKEPSGVSVVYSVVDQNVSIKWTDPDDISTNRPAQAEWAGTVVVRKEGSAPRNKWDGTIIVDSTTRDEYKTNALIDDTAQSNKTYYYGIFPYDTLGDYRFTKVVQVNTKNIAKSPVITDIHMGGAGTWDGSEVDILWSGDSNKLTVQVSSGHILFKLYTGNTVIYSWQSPVGTSASDSDTAKIHAAFLEDSNNEIAKPSFVYHTGTGVYSYNQEDPTDSEMEAIYLWLHPSS